MAQAFAVDATITIVTQPTLPAGMVSLQPGTSPTIQLHKGPGWVPLLQALIDEFTRPGGTGSGTQIVGARAQKKSFPVMVAGDDKTALSATASLIEGLKGKVVSITNSLGQIIPRVKVSDASIDSLKACGGAAAYRLEATLEFEVLTNPNLAGT